MLGRLGENERQGIAREGHGFRPGLWRGTRRVGIIIAVTFARDYLFSLCDEVYPLLE